jgi:hypothetical protein
MNRILTAALMLAMSSGCLAVDPGPSTGPLKSGIDLNYIDLAGRRRTTSLGMFGHLARYGPNSS